MSALEAEKIVQESAAQIANGTSPLDTKMAEMLADTDNIASMPKLMLDEWNQALNSSGNLATLYTALADKDVGIGAKAEQAGTAIKDSYEAVRDDLLELQEGNKQLLNKILDISFPNANDWNAKITAWIADLYAAIHTESPSNKPESNAMVENALQSGYASKNVKGELQFSSKMFEELGNLEGYTLGEGFWNITNKWNSEKIAKAIEWYLKGDHTADEIARKFNLSMEGENPDLVTPEVTSTVLNHTNVPTTILNGHVPQTRYEPKDNSFLIKQDINITVEGNMDEDVTDKMLERFADEVNNSSNGVNMVRRAQK